MAKRPTLPCAGTCGRLLWAHPTSLPAGEAMCRDCRAARALVSCPVCETPFRPEPAVETCSLSCGATLRHRRAGVTPGSRRAKDRTRCAKRRARVASAVVESVDPDVVFARDGWTCHVCAEPIDPTLSGRHRMGPTLDHLIPLAHDGEHSYANVAAAHRVCNSRKGLREAVGAA